MSVSPNKINVVDWIAQRTGRIFGFRIAPTTEQDIFDITELAIEQDEQLIIASQNLHGLYVATTDEAFRKLHELPQSMIHIDGFPIVYIAWLHGLRHTKMEHRNGVHDWLPNYVREASNKGWRIFCLGSSTDVNARALDALTKAAPNANMAGRNGFFDVNQTSADNQAVLNEIAEFDPHIILVGMGMGRQERWMLENRVALGNRCIVVVGACLEYMAGEMKISPRWCGPFGLEAAWRLVTHPRRYGHRYLIEPWLLLAQLVKTGRLFGRNT